MANLFFLGQPAFEKRNKKIATSTGLFHLRSESFKACNEDIASDADLSFEVSRYFRYHGYSKASQNNKIN